MNESRKKIIKITSFILLNLSILFFWPTISLWLTFAIKIHSVNNLEINKLFFILSIVFTLIFLILITITIVIFIVCRKYKMINQNTETQFDVINKEKNNYKKTNNKEQIIIDEIKTINNDQNININKLPEKESKTPKKIADIKNSTQPYPIVASDLKI